METKRRLHGPANVAPPCAPDAKRISDAREMLRGEIDRMNVQRPARLSLIAYGLSALTVRLTPPSWLSLARRAPEQSLFHRYITDLLRSVDISQASNVPIVIPTEHVQAFRLAYRAEFGRDYPADR